MNRMSFPFIRKAMTTLPWVLVALSLAACSNSTTESCSSGLVCPTGWTCSAAGDACIQGHCGDGIEQDNEVCDDGNHQDGDGCNSTCTSNEKCGNGHFDPGEACDDGNTVNGDSCSEDCKHSAECGNRIIDANEECDPPGDRDGYLCNQSCQIAFCGNGQLDEGEQCDDGNTNDDDDCLTTCLWNTCGDGHRNPATEACDDGNRSTETTCLYGTKDCTICQADCQAEVTINGSYCGDGKKDANETCDDGLANGKKTCPYGMKDCKVCNADCKAQEDGTGSYCGDAIRNAPFEECDFGQACGTCSTQCKFIAPNQATGSITVTNPGKIHEGDVVVLSDGSNLPVTFRFSATCGSPWTYSYTCDDGDNQPACCISLKKSADVYDGAPQLASKLRDAVNMMFWPPLAALNVSAIIEDSSDTVVQLTHGSPVAWGNQYIKTTTTSGLAVEGMSGGVGHDCPDNSQCMSDDDCATNSECKRDMHCRRR
jgi:cysteine-rich repeat protein